MKVLIATDWYVHAINGVVISVKNLEEQLRKRGHDVRILTLSDSIHSYKKDNVYYIGSVRAGKLYPKARFGVMKKNGGIFEDIMDWKPDIIHSQSEFSTFIASKVLANRLHVPIVHTYHTIYENYTHYFSPSQKMGRRMAELLTRVIARYVSEIIVPSQKVSEMLQNYGVSCPIEVIPSGINVEDFHRCFRGNWRSKVRGKLEIPENRMVLIYIGRLAREKNIDELLEFQQMASAQGTELVLVGDGPYRAELEKETVRLGIEQSVRFTGMVSPSQVGQYYQAGDLFVSASTSETQGLTYVEALASGLPLLCRKDPCLDGMVVNGENGWQYRDLPSFLQSLKAWKKKSENERLHMRESAAFTADDFSAWKFGERVEKVYEKNLRRKAADI